MIPVCVNCGKPRPVRSQPTCSVACWEAVEARDDYALKHIDCRHANGAFCIIQLLAMKEWREAFR